MARVRTILFLPNFSGAGFGHIGQCLPIAEAWARRNGRAVFGLGGPHAHRVAEAGFETQLFKFWRVPRAAARPIAYTFVNDLSYQAVRDGLDHPIRVELALYEASQMVRRVKPDVLVGDGCLLTYLLGAKTGLPVVQIVKSFYHPKPQPIAAWESAPEGQILPDVRPIFNPILSRLKLQPLKKVEDLIQGDLYLLNGIPTLDPMNPLPEKTCYVGPTLRRPAPSGPKAGWQSWVDAKRPLVYVTIGGASHTGISEDLFSLFVEAFGNEDYQVILSTGGISGLRLPKLPANLRLETWIDNSLVLPACQAVVFHGGTTRMEVAWHGLPSVVIPFQTEQEYYGRRLANAGAACLLQYSNEPYIHIPVKWRGGQLIQSRSFSLYIRLHPDLKPEALRHVVRHALYDPTMRSKAIELKKECCEYGGSEQALDLIEAHCSV